MRDYTPDLEWMAERIAPLPTKWQQRLSRAWHATHDADPFTANTRLRLQTDQLGSLRVPLDAGDAEICAFAQTSAARCADLATRRHDAPTLRAAMSAMVQRFALAPPADKVRDGPAIARMACPLWWRRKLRRQQGRAVESAAIVLGLVHKRSEIYCSDETLHRRQQQNRRNAEALANTKAVNELGQEFTLAELAAKGPANKAIKRAELMTRIAGFERIARELGHGGLFITITCPSRMHAHRTVGGWKVEPNPRYDNESTPRTAQQYLAKVWARIRAQFKHQATPIYGFRIAEPQHDGTPHWHLLVFHAPDDAEAIRSAITKHAMRDSPDEPGAHAHRCDFRAIDWAKGSAAGYIAKYVAKNIDGYAVGDDLHGNPALETSARVEAWATTWGIRQFQQVGGPPVGVWRELRRVEALPAGAPAHLVKAHNAVNKVAVIEGKANQSVAWHHYVQAQGGVFCGRAYRIQLDLLTDETRKNRYGETSGPRPVGVSTTAIEHYTPDHMAYMNPPPQIPRTVHWFVESTRHIWTITAGKTKPVFEFLAPAAPVPWTRVNNCTDGVGAGFPEGAALDDDDLRAMHHDEFGRWAGWSDRLHAAQAAKQPFDMEKEAARLQI